jgi:hypothetical protein
MSTNLSRSEAVMAQETLQRREGPLRSCEET